MTAINEAGQATGTLNGSDGLKHAVLWDAAGVTDLGVLPGGNYSRGFCINNSGHVAGKSDLQDWAGEHGNAVLWDEMGIHLVLSDADANGLNDSGEIVGICGLGTYSGAYAWENGNVRYLPALGQWHSEALDINNHDQIVGWSMVSPLYNHACLWDDAGVTDLGTLPGRAESIATDINDNGLVVGESNTGVGSGPFPCYWDSTGIHALPLVPNYYYAECHAVNNLGQVVGQAEYESNPRDAQAKSACMWQNGTLVYPSMSENAYRCSFNDINDNGWIAGSFTDAGIPNALPVLWIPIPEPSSLLALLCGVVGVVWRRRLTPCA